MNAIETLAERSMDMGLRFTYEGEFDTLADLVKIFDEIYPWGLPAEPSEEAELILELLDNEYIYVYDDEIESIQVEGKKIYTAHREIDVMEMFDKIIYDRGTKNYLLAFSNSGWLHVDAAIDLASGTIGYFNAQENIFTPVKNISEDDAIMLRGVIKDYDFTADWVAEVKRVRR